MTHNLNIEQIKSLLARFYEGKTTPEEEQILADIFRLEDIPEDLQQDKQLFLVLAQVSEQEMPSDIAEEITAFVYNLGQTKIQPHIYEDKQQKAEEMVSRSCYDDAVTRARWWYVGASTPDITFP